MANINDYIIWRGDLPVSPEFPFNEVDSMVLARFSYLVMQKIDMDAVETVGDISCKMKDLPEGAFRYHGDMQLIHLMGESVRFNDMKVTDFVLHNNEEIEKQFGAVTIHYLENQMYISYMGTDASLVGWKEDFNISYLPETEGQRQSAAYLNRHFVGRRGTLMTGGHSKGGNFAVYAAAMAAPGVRERIHRIYNNDGPGFREAFVSRAGYLSVRDKIVSIIPAGSVIGVLLANVPPDAVVASDAQGIVQHDGFSWQVLGTDFVPGARTALSLYIEDTLSRWIEGESDADRRHFVDGLFDIFNEGLDQMDDLSNKRLVSLAKCVRALKNLPLDERQQFIKVTLDLLRQGGAVAGEKSETWLKGIEEKLPEIKLSLPDKLKKL